jgi:hypothetical protein
MTNGMTNTAILKVKQSIFFINQILGKNYTKHASSYLHAEFWLSFQAPALKHKGG